MGDAGREELARRQTELVNALAGGAEPPAEFDRGRVELAARTLVQKRMRTVKKTWPALEKDLGGRFAGVFGEYARVHALPVDHETDGAGFAAFLARRGLLGDGGKLQWAEWRVWRGWPVGFARLSDGWVIVVRLWGGRLRRFRGLRRRRRHGGWRV